MEELLDLAINKIANIERKIEKYFQILKVENELDFVLNGSYILNDALGEIISGQYEVNNG